MVRTLEGFGVLRESVGEIALEDGTKLELSISMSGSPIVVNQSNNKIFTLSWEELVEQAEKEGILK